MSQIDVQALRRSNPALAAFFDQEYELKKSERERTNRVDELNAELITGVSLNVEIGNRAELVAQDSNNQTYFRWTVFVRVTPPKYILSVTFGLHHTFTPQYITVHNDESGEFEVTRTGWGTFEIEIQLNDVSGNRHILKHSLAFSNPLPASASSSSTSSSLASTENKQNSVKNTENLNVKTCTLKILPMTKEQRAKALGETTEEKKTVTINTSPPQPRMEGVDVVGMHGHLGTRPSAASWRPPFLVTYCEAEARPGYKSMAAHEYNDDPETLRGKVKVLAELIRASKHCLAYTGAGISTASGIDDYASQSKASVATGSNAVGRAAKKTGLDASPTFAHRTLAALYRVGHLAHWMQQNHDGLPQKAGFPQEAINEIHGAWFDPSNPVVPMSGSLRGDLFRWMEVEEHKADLVLTMGSSLCGMNADRMVETAGKKFVKKQQGLGAVIIGFQRTILDELASLRIYANIDQTMLLLALEMDLPINFRTYTPVIPAAAKGPEDHMFLIPYDTKGTGKKTSGKRMLWDLRAGAKIRLTGGPGVNFLGTIVRCPVEELGEYSYSVRLPSTREDHTLGKGLHNYAFGTWFVEAACKGAIPTIPMVNISE